jgi:hypothetical protein
MFCETSLYHCKPKAFFSYKESDWQTKGKATA